MKSCWFEVTNQRPYLDVKEVLDDDHVHIVLYKHAQRLVKLLMHFLLVPVDKAVKPDNQVQFLLGGDIGLCLGDAPRHNGPKLLGHLLGDGAGSRVDLPAGQPVLLAAFGIKGANPVVCGVEGECLRDVSPGFGELLGEGLDTFRLLVRGDGYVWTRQQGYLHSCLGCPVSCLYVPSLLQGNNIAAVSENHFSLT